MFIPREGRGSWTCLCLCGNPPTPFLNYDHCLAVLRLAPSYCPTLEQLLNDLWVDFWITLLFPSLLNNNTPNLWSVLRWYLWVNMAAGESSQVSALPLPPMQYVSLYSEDSLRRGRAPKPPAPIKVSTCIIVRYWIRKNICRRPLVLVCWMVISQINLGSKKMSRQKAKVCYSVFLFTIRCLWCL